MSTAAVAAGNTSSTTTVGSTATPQLQQQLQTTTNSTINKKSAVCPHYFHGICRYRLMCRFSPDLISKVDTGELAATISLPGGANWSANTIDGGGCNADDVAAITSKHAF